MVSVGGLGSLLGPMLAVLGRFGPYVGGLGPLLEPMFAVLGPLGTYVGSLRPLLGPMLAVLGRSSGLCWRSWVALGTHVGDPRPSWDLCWRSWPTLRAYVGGIEPLLRPMLAVLGRSWGLYGRSRARKCEEHGYLENMVISRAGARSAAWGSVLSWSWGLCCRSCAALGPL